MSKDGCQVLQNYILFRLTFVLYYLRTNNVLLNRITLDSGGYVTLITPNLILTAALYVTPFDFTLTPCALCKLYHVRSHTSPCTLYNLSGFHPYSG
jgi:hypothetical protein